MLTDDLNNKPLPLQPFPNFTMAFSNGGFRAAVFRRAHCLTKHLEFSSVPLWAMSTALLEKIVAPLNDDQEWGNWTGQTMQPHQWLEGKTWQ